MRRVVPLTIRFAVLREEWCVMSVERNHAPRQRHVDRTDPGDGRRWLQLLGGCQPGALGLNASQTAELGYLLPVQASGALLS